MNPALPGALPRQAGRFDLPMGGPVSRRVNCMSLDMQANSDSPGREEVPEAGREALHPLEARSVAASTGPIEEEVGEGQFQKRPYTV